MSYREKKRERKEKKRKKKKAGYRWFLSLFLLTLYDAGRGPAIGMLGEALLFDAGRCPAIEDAGLCPSI